MDAEGINDTEPATVAPKPTARAFLSKYGRKASEPYPLPLSTGEVWTARTVVDAEELKTFREKAAVLRNALDASPPKNWQPFLPVSDENLSFIILFTELLIEPKFTQLEALEAKATAGTLFVEIGQKLMNGAQAQAAKVEDEKVEQAKNAS